MASAHQAFRAQRVFRDLDGLRALSILAVIWHHVQYKHPAWPILERTNIGVDIFFVLSGFLITTLLLRERERDGGISLRAFYWRRLLRIVPPYFAVLLALALLYALTGSASLGPYLRELPYHLLYVSDWIGSVTIMGISWSLSAEMQFYLAWPLLERFAPKLVPLGLVVGLALNQLLARGFFGVPAGLNIVETTFTPILLGVLLAHMLHHPNGFDRVAFVLARPFAPLVLLLAMLAVLQLAPGFGPDVRLVLHLLMVGLLASCMCQERHVLSAVLNHALVRRWGVVSYGLYLFHMIGRQGARAIEDRIGLSSPVVVLLLCFALTWALAELSFRFLEQPILRLKRPRRAPSALGLRKEAAPDPGA